MPNPWRSSRRREAVFWAPVTAVIRRIYSTAARRLTRAATAAVPMCCPGLWTVVDGLGQIADRELAPQEQINLFGRDLRPS